MTMDFTMRPTAANPIEMSHLWTFLHAILVPYIKAQLGFSDPAT